MWSYLLVCEVVFKVYRKLVFWVTPKWLVPLFCLAQVCRDQQRIFDQHPGNSQIRSYIRQPERDCDGILLGSLLVQVEQPKGRRQALEDQPKVWSDEVAETWNEFGYQLLSSKRGPDLWPAKDGQWVSRHRHGVGWSGFIGRQASNSVLRPEGQDCTWHLRRIVVPPLQVVAPIA